MLNKKTMMFAALAVVMPMAAFAADADDALTKIGEWLGTLGQLIIAATVVAFFWGVFMFVFDDSKKDDGKQMMMWSIVGIFVMVSLWGIIGFLQSTTGTGDGTIIDTTNLVPKVI